MRKTRERFYFFPISLAPIKNRSVPMFLVSIFALCAMPYALCQDMPTSGELITKAWELHGQKKHQETLAVTQQVIDLYKEEADKQQAALSGSEENIATLQPLGDVATAYFIQAESYRDQGKEEEAVKAFKTVMYQYCYAQAWDQRGWYWKLAQAAFESVVNLKPDEKLDPCPCKGLSYIKKALPEHEPVSQLPSRISLADPGKEKIVDYAKYGEFQNIGSKDYRYVIKDQAGLSMATGEGVYPNTISVRQDPAFKQAVSAGRLKGDYWDFLQSADLEAAFFKWALAPEPPGIRLFYTAGILEKSALIEHALKCYYAIVVHFPGSYGWTYWHTPWYVGQAALAKINYLLRRHPQIGYRLEGASIYVVNGFDNDVSNDIVLTEPGKFIKAGLLDKFKRRPDIDLISVKRRIGKGQVHLLQYETGDWQLIVTGKPYIIKGITYNATQVGQSPDNATLTSWMEDDLDLNGLADGPYDSFVDRNKNNLQDSNEPAVGDFRLMREMGVNTLRLYHHPQRVDKDVLRKMYARYGMRVIMGDFLGKYALGSGAAWNPGTDYNNELHRKNMMESVLSMVLEYKDEPYILFWLLGNENVYGYACNADKDPRAFFRFANEAALAIKEIDREHPVAIGNGDILYLDKFGQLCPDIDIFGANAYRGNYGFGCLWEQVKKEADKPVFITEYGCPAYAEGKTPEEAEELQAEYHQAAWEDIEHNLAFRGGSGNALGGVVFEWLDEWWKAYEPSRHDTKGLWVGPFPDGFMHEEWLGLCGQGNGGSSPFLRHLRKAYFRYKKMWR